MSLMHLLGLDRKGLKLSTGERVEIKPLTVKQAFIVEKIFGPIAEGALEVGLDNPTLYAAYADDMCAIVAVALNRHVDWVENLPRGDFTAILAKLLEVERDFFGALLAQASRANPEAGPKFSKR